MSGALSQQAEATFGALGPEEQAAARRMFGRLVTLGEGTEDTRRRILTSNLGDDEATRRALDSFGRARLVSFDRNASTREPTVEIAHEALLREWARLGSWLDEDRADLRIEQHLARVAEEWRSSDRPESELYRGGRLESALEWADANPDTPTAAEWEFLEAARDRAEEERRREQQRIRRLRGLVVAAGVATVVALIAGLIANSQRSDAEGARIDAEHGELVAVAAARASSDPDPSLAMLLAAEAYARRPDGGSRDALMRSLTANDGFLGYLSTPDGYETRALAYALDGRLVTRTAHSIDVWDMETREISTSIDVGEGDDLSVAGDLAFTIVDGALLQVRLDTDAVVTVDTDAVVTVDTDATVGSFAVSADGSMMAIADPTGGLELSSAPRWESTHRLPPEEESIEALWFDPSGTWLVGVLRRGLAVENVGSEWEPGDDTGMLPELEEDARQFVVWKIWASDDVPVRAGELEDVPAPPLGRTARSQTPHLVWLDDETVMVSIGHPPQVNTTALGKDAGYVHWPAEEPLLVALDQQRVLWGSTVYDLSTGAAERELTAATGTPVAAATLEDRVLALATDQSISLWSVDGTQLLARALPRAGVDYVVSLDWDGDRLLTNKLPAPTEDEYEEVRVWDVESGRLLDDVPEDQSHFSPSWAWWGPEGNLWTNYGSSGGELLGISYSLLGDAETLEPVDFDIPVHESLGALPFAASPDRRFVARPHTIGVLMEPVTEGAVFGEDEFGAYGEEMTELGEASSLLPHHGRGGEARKLRFSWDSSWLAAVSHNGAVVVWDTSTPEPQAELLWEEPDSRYVHLAFNRARTLLAVVDVDGRVHFFDTNTWEKIGEPLRGAPTDLGDLDHGLPETGGIQFSEDDRFLLVAGGSSAQLFDVVDRRPIGGPLTSRVIEATSPSVDGSRLATGAEDHILVWNLDPDTWADLVCRAAGRSLTEDEWAAFIGDEPHDPYCT